MKRIVCLIIMTAMLLSGVTAVFADSSAKLELTEIEYVLKKGTREVNIVTLSNKMEVRVRLKNTSKTSQTVKVRVDGYLNNKIVSAQTKTSDYVGIPAGSVSDTVNVQLGNVKTYCDTIKVYAVADGYEKKIAVFPYISLGIKLNGKELEDYSDDKDEYTAVIDTPYPYFEIDERSVMQKDLNKGYDYKLPYTRTITVSQVGKDDNHKLPDRTVTINLDTTSASIPHIINDNMIFWGKTDNNTDQNVFDLNATVWKDLSGYKNDIDKIYDIWTGKGLKVTSKWDETRLTAFPAKITETVNSGSFSLKFTPTAINSVEGANLCLFGSDNGNFRIFIKKDSGRICFKWGDARYTPEMVSVDAGEAEGKENAVTVEDGKVSWYIDGILKSQKQYPVDKFNTVGKITFSDVKEGNVGSVAFEEIKFFDKALSADELQNTDILNPDTTMEQWYSNVENGIALCGEINKGTKTLDGENITYFCLPGDTYAKENADAIAAKVKESVKPSELEADFASYDSISKLAQSVIVEQKSQDATVDITTDELKVYINNTLPEDIAALADKVEDSAIAGIKNRVNKTASGSAAAFKSAVTEQLIIASITDPKEFAPEEVAERIIEYADELGIDLNGYDNASKDKQARIARSIMSAKPSTAEGIESLIKSGMGNQNQNNNAGGGGGTSAGGSNVGGGSAGGGGLPTKPSAVHGSDTQTPDDTAIAGFTDMKGFEWVKEALEYMVGNGYVYGVGENKFAPGNNVTRSEFVAMIARCEGFEDTDDTESVFEDVPVDFWGFKNIMSAYRKNIISGVGNGRFNPSGKITRQDMAVILYNVYKLKAEQNEQDTDFADWDEISDYAKDAVGKLHALKILNGNGSGFSPKGLCTRAEAVQAIYNYIKAVNK